MVSTATDVRSSSGFAPDDVSSYRAYLTFAAQPDAVDLATQQISGWLRDKGYGEVDLSSSQFLRLSDKTELVVAHSNNRRGASMRVRLAETDNRDKQWLTSIAIHSPQRGSGWVSVRSGHTGGKPAETPNIARYLMEVLDLRDSEYHVVAGAPIVRPDGVEELLDAVCDTDRNGLIFVAGTDASSADLFAPFAERAERWARRVHGLAQFVILDPAATEEFNAGIGETHAAPPWTIRTYFPGADPAWEPDARRHRILGTRRLADERDHVISGIVVGAARKHSANHTLPDVARTIIKDLNRVEDRLFMDSLFAKPEDTTASDAPALPVAESDVEATAEVVVSAAEGPLESAAQKTPAAGPETETANVAPETDTDHSDRADTPTADVEPDTEVAAAVAEYLATIEMVKAALGVDDLDPQVLRQIANAASHTADQAAAREAIADRVGRQLAERQAEIDALEDRLVESREVTDEAILDQRIAEDARLKAEDESRWLRRLLDEQGRHEDAWAPVPDAEATKVPASFDDLLDRFDELEELGVVFTGDRRITVGLDDQDTLGNIVASAWECLLVLGDYIAAKQAGDFEGNVMTYLTQTPSGYRNLPKTRFGERESKSTRTQWGDDRIFNVPAEVHADGGILMEAHFKLPRCGMVTPRIHYYDHTHADGKIYVGYIGPHLRTKAT